MAESQTRFLLNGPSGKSVELTGSTVAGRNPDCDIVLVEGHPSRRHAQITLRDNTVWIEDLGSANGTFVNDRQINAAVQLRSGDRVRFDAEVWQFMEAAPTPLEAQTVVRAPSGTDHQTVIPKPTQSARAPGSWADPDLKDGQGTKLFDPKDLQKMLQEGGSAPVAPAAVDAPYVSVKSGRSAGENLKLKPGPAGSVWKIGSDSTNDVAIVDDGVSGFHATIKNEGARWKLTDQMSANGTFVNGAKISVHFLSSGDRLRFGPIDCVFQLPSTSKQSRGGKRAPLVIATISFVATAAVLAAVWWLM
jgi:pSer/pThr/pTyr-binding forkhead associated (FHA) protein